MVDQIRVGIVGAGANTRLRHVPGFRAIDGVEILGVVNRSPESTARAASEFDIPRTYDDWTRLIDDPDIDAVMIGTWPNMHCEVTCTALAAGKHILTEARMARNFEEARRMLAASDARPDLVTQIVPSPLGLVHHDAIRDLIEDGFLGDLREVVVVAADASFRDTTQPLHWRQNREISGFNTMALGIFHEALIRFAPDPTRVFAQTEVFETSHADGINGKSAADVPDSLQILTRFQSGSGEGRGLYHISAIALHGPEKRIELYGSEGTIRITFGANEVVEIGQSGDDSLRVLNVPTDKRGGWRVEAEFIGAIRGTESVRFTDFETGARYMAFTEAVAESADQDVPVSIPR